MTTQELANPTTTETFVEDQELELRTKQMLNDLVALKLQIARASLRRDKEIQSKIPPEIQASIDSVNIYYGSMIDAYVKRENELGEKIRKNVLTLQKTVQGEDMQCVYSRGRRSVKIEKFISFVDDVELQLNRFFGMFFESGMHLTWEAIQPRIRALVLDLRGLIETSDPSTSISERKHKEVRPHSNVDIPSADIPF